MAVGGGAHVRDIFRSVRTGGGGGAYPGAHSGTLHISTAIGSRDVPVSLYVTGHGPFLSVFPDGLQFSTVEVSKLVDSRTISLQNSGDAQAMFSADVVDGQNWLSLDTASGTVAAGTATQLTASVNTGILGPGTYGGLIRISAPDSSFSPLYAAVLLRIETGATPAIPLLLSAGGVVLQAPLGAEERHVSVTLSAASANPVTFQVAGQSSGWLSPAHSPARCRRVARCSLKLRERPSA